MLIIIVLLLAILAMTTSLQVSTSPLVKRSSIKLRNQLQMKVSSDDNDTVMFGGVIGTVGVISSLICGYSLYVLKTTSCGLPPGPFGLEGMSVVGVPYFIL
jgi:hypothetical protein